MEIEDPNKSLLGLSKNTSMDWQFENPLAGCDFATGKYFNRIEEYWENEYLRNRTAGSKGIPKIGDYETAKRKILESRMSGVEAEEAEIINAIKRLAINGVAPSITEPGVKKYYTKANKLKGWAWYVRKAGLKLRVGRSKTGEYMQEQDARKEGTI